MNRDKNKKSCIRGVDFEIVKKANFAPEVYKYAQTMSLQKEFDDRKVTSKKVAFSKYRNFYSTTYKDKQVSTKIFALTQKYKDWPNGNDENRKKFEKNYLL